MSTEEVYGDFRGPVAHEDDLAKPLMAYGITKLAVEHFGRSYREVHGIDCINLRTSWVYGVRLDRPRPPMNYMNAALAGRPLHVATGADVITDYIHVEDLIDAILAALDHPVHKYDVYNVGSGEAISEGELVAIVKNLVPGADISVGAGRREFAPGVRIPLKGALDISRAKSEFEYSPRFDIRSGLEAYAAAWRRAVDARNAPHI